MYDWAVSDAPTRPPRSPRSETREVSELRALRERQPELTDAIDLQLELLEHQRRIQSRISLPWFELNSGTIASHQNEGRPLVRFEEIPLDLTDLRLLVRQTADIIALSPPLIVEQSHIDQIFETLAAMLKTV